MTDYVSLLNRLCSGVNVMENPDVLLTEAYVAIGSLLTEIADLQQELHDAEGKADGLGKDAQRYRWFRAQHWDSSAICAVVDPKTSTKLGAYCPSADLLDSAIDAAISLSKEAQS